MKARRAWQGFYLDLQRRILKSRFSERLALFNAKSALSKCSPTMNGTFSTNHIFLSFFQPSKLLQIFLNRALKWAPTGPIDARTLVVTPRNCLFHRRVLNQANNEPLHPNPHPLWPWLACCVWRNWLSQVLLTTEHTKLHVGQLVIWKTLLELRSRRGFFLEAVNSEMEHEFP